ncbi:MAG: aromatic ring-hydroxylating dioxygenase subunit alpha, partial [Alphaproteobacteria bacterium]|nr:aromatic ring-hydroxylating dioxygenase subunit alpha [Alphaproteobacteria bacterium]
YEAQVSQRPIAVHGLEHLATTDRGVAMFRKLVRNGIQAVRDGRDPLGLSRGNAVLPTFCNDTVVHQPPAADPKADPIADRAAMRATGRRLAEGYVKDPPLLPRA